MWGGRSSIWPKIHSFSSITIKFIIVDVNLDIQVRKIPWQFEARLYRLLNV